MISLAMISMICSAEPMAKAATKSWTGAMLNSMVSFKQEILNDFGSQNNYTQATTSLKTKLVRNLSFETAVSVQRNSQIPPESQNKKNLDTNTTFSLVYSF